MVALRTPLDQIPFVSVDVETTGLNPRRDAILEIGAVKMVSGRLQGEFSTLVYVDHTIPYDAQRVHGITNDMLIGKPRVGEALRMFLDFAGDGALVEHSHKIFDIAFLEQAQGSPVAAPCINTCTLSRRLFPHLPKHTLAECCRRFQIQNEQSHRALGDARATAHLLRRLLELCSSRYPHLEDLITVASIERAAETRRRSSSFSRRSRRRP